MNSKLLTLVAAGAFALSATAALAQRAGPPSNEGNSDSSQNSAQPKRPAGTQGQGGAMGGGTAGQGTQAPAMGDNTPLQPGGVSPSAAPQGREDSPNSAQPRPR